MPSNSLTVQVERRIYFVRGEKVMLDADLARKLDALEKKYDAQFKVVFDAIRELMTPAEQPKRQIGFHPHE